MTTPMCGYLHSTQEWAGMRSNIRCSAISSLTLSRRLLPPFAQHVSDDFNTYANCSADTVGEDCTSEYTPRDFVWVATCREQGGKEQAVRGAKTYTGASPQNHTKLAKELPQVLTNVCPQCQHACLCSSNIPSKTSFCHNSSPQRVSATGTHARTNLLKHMQDWSDHSIHHDAEALSEGAHDV